MQAKTASSSNQPTTCTGELSLPPSNLEMSRKVLGKKLKTAPEEVQHQKETANIRLFAFANFLRCNFHFWTLKAFNFKLYCQFTTYKNDHRLISVIHESDFSENQRIWRKISSWLWRQNRHTLSFRVIFSTEKTKRNLKCGVHKEIANYRRYIGTYVPTASRAFAALTRAESQLLTFSRDLKL